MRAHVKQILEWRNFPAAGKAMMKIMIMIPMMEQLSNCSRLLCLTFEWKCFGQTWKDCGKLYSRIRRKTSRKI